jgi:hypothetical protein
MTIAPLARESRNEFGLEGERRIAQLLRTAGRPNAIEKWFAEFEPEAA